jgi:L-threonylcarbamoyladenylate synthase
MMATGRRSGSPPLSGPSRNSDLVNRASAALRAGEVVAIPTDTVYGLAAAIDRPDAIWRLYALKDRPIEKAIPVLLSDPSQLPLVAASVPATAAHLASSFWPGALTLVLPALPHLPRRLTSTSENGLRTVAVRVPDHPLARSIIAESGGALAVTSANRSGQEPARDATAAAAIVASPPLLVIDGGQAPGGIPSTVILAIGSEPEILRGGAITAAAIAEALGNLHLAAGGGANPKYDQPMTEHDRHKPITGTTS